MRNVVVTGGSRGLGLGILRRLTAEGYGTVAVARHMNEQLAATMEQIDQARPGALQFIPFDLPEFDVIPEWVRRLHKAFGPIYGFVKNRAAAAAGALRTMPTSRIQAPIPWTTLPPSAFPC